MCSENHAVKQGFFLSLSMIMQKYEKIDAKKFIELVQLESKTNQTMKNPEL